MAGTACRALQRKGEVSIPAKAGELLGQLAGFGFKGVEVARGVRKDGAKAGVKFDGAGLPNDFGEVGSGDARSGKDEDAVARGGDEFGEFGSASESGFRASGSENSGSAGLHDRFKRALQVRRFVEGAVKRHG